MDASQNNLLNKILFTENPVQNEFIDNSLQN